MTIDAEESIAQAERPRWGERSYYAKILRTKGWLLSLKGDLKGTERSCLASLDLGAVTTSEIMGTAHRDELCAAHARPGTNQGILRTSRPIYAWFTEGFGTKDLKDCQSVARRAAGMSRSEGLVTIEPEPRSSTAEQKFEFDVDPADSCRGYLTAFASWPMPVANKLHAIPFCRRTLTPDYVAITWSRSRSSLFCEPAEARPC